MKRDGSIRISGDYKVTNNKAAKVDSYPLPRIEDLFSTLGKGKTYTKLDLAHAYQQIELDDKSKELATINTQKGLCIVIAGYRSVFRPPLQSSKGPSRVFCTAFPMLLSISISS